MASMNDPFQFQDFDDDGNLLGPNRDAVTININNDEIPERQKKSASLNHLEEDENSAGDDETGLLTGQRQHAPFWTFEYYQKFFDIETHHVKERIIGSLLPWPGKNFIQVYLRKNPDLYGPIWICITLVFAIAISGNLFNFLVHLGKPDYKYTPEFRKVSIAATAIFSYAWLVPLGLWGFLLWRSRKTLSLVSYSFMEILCVYGYSLSIYIPVVILWILPFEWLRWCSIVVALCLSGSVLVITFLPAVRDDHPRVIVATLSTVVLLNLLLAVGCKAYFFSRSVEPDHSPAAAAVVDVIKTTNST